MRGSGSPLKTKNAFSAFFNAFINLQTFMREVELVWPLSQKPSNGWAAPSASNRCQEKGASFGFNCRQCQSGRKAKYRFDPGERFVELRCCSISKAFSKEVGNARCILTTARSKMSCCVLAIHYGSLFLHR